jgi:hypothetical protein
VDSLFCEPSLIVLKACIIRILYRHWRFFRRTGQTVLQISLSVVLRVIIFCVYRLVVAAYVCFPHILFLCPVSDHLNGYLLGYIWTCRHERAYVATILNVQGTRAPTGPNGVEVSFTPTWVDMLQARSAFGRHRAIATLLVLTISDCHSPACCFSYLWHEQGAYCSCSNSVAGTAISGISWCLDVLEKVQPHSRYVDVPAQTVSRNTKGIHCPWRCLRYRECDVPR